MKGGGTNDDDSDDDDDDNSMFDVNSGSGWRWLEGFPGWEKSLHSLVKGFGEFEDHVFIGGEDFLADWNVKEGKKGIVKKTAGEVLIAKPPIVTPPIVTPL